jgi:hypothetical protein
MQLREEKAYNPHQFYNTKYIPCKSLKIPLKPPFVFLSTKDNLVNSFSELTVNYKRGYIKDNRVQNPDTQNNLVYLKK